MCHLRIAGDGSETKEKGSTVLLLTGNLSSQTGRRKGGICR